MIWVLALLLTSTSSALAAPLVSGPEAAYYHQKLARESASAKQWQKARDEAKLAADANPDSSLNRDAWLLLGATEERLGNLPEARDAYAKYLRLSPPPDKQQVVMQRYVEVEPKAERYTRYKWGSNSGAITLGYSPVFQSNMQTQLESELKTAIDVGLRFGMFSFGYKRGKALTGAFQAPTPDTATALNDYTPTYETVPAGGYHLMESLYFQVNFPLGPNPETNQIVVGIPLHLAGVSNAIRLEDDTLYNNLAYDIGLGLRVDFYTKSPLSFDISAMYHYSIPFGDVVDTDGYPIKNLADEVVVGSNTGFEFRVGAKILFGASPPEED